MIALPDDFFDLLCLKQMAACLLLYWLPKHNSWEFIRQPLACLKVCNLLFFCVCKVWWVVAMTICQQLFHHGNRSWNQLSPTYFAKSYLCRWEYYMDLLWSSKLQKGKKHSTASRQFVVQRNQFNGFLASLQSSWYFSNGEW